MNKLIKVSLVLIAALNINNNIVGSSLVVEKELVESTFDHFSSLFNSFNEIKIKVASDWEKLLDEEHYPEMSWAAFCDQIIKTIEEQGDMLPAAIRSNLIEIVLLKRNCKDGIVQQKNARHAIINDTMVLLIDELIKILQAEAGSIISLGILPEDIKIVRNNLVRFKKDAIALRKDHKKCYSLDSAFDELEKLGSTLKPILDKNLVHLEKFRSALDLGKETTAPNLVDKAVAVTIALNNMAIINRRIAQS